MLVRPEGLDAVLEARWLEPDWQADAETVSPDTVRVVWRRKTYGTGTEPFPASRGHDGDPGRGRGGNAPGAVSLFAGFSGRPVPGLRGLPSGGVSPGGR